jgi:hypothetical protein
MYEPHHPVHIEGRVLARRTFPCLTQIAVLMTPLQVHTMLAAIIESQQSARLLFSLGEEPLDAAGYEHMLQESVTMAVHVI